MGPNRVVGEIGITKRGCPVGILIFAHNHYHCVELPTATPITKRLHKLLATNQEAISRHAQSGK
jgi:hypothetical protein